MLKEQLAELRRIVRLHVNWLVVSVSGRDSITAGELHELEDYGKLPITESLDLAKKAYVLGRLKMLLKKAEWKELTLDALKLEVAKAQLSSVEELAIQQARLHAGENLKNVAQDLEKNAIGTVADVLKTEIVETILGKHSAKDLAPALAKRLGGHAKDWKRVAETELHTAKMQGATQAIVNQVGIYSKSAGIDSDVSIVPSSGTCEDCEHHYLDRAGNPKVYKLKDLLASGSNTNHKRAGKRHAHWQPTIPPLHPSCACSLVYIPVGFGWVDGKLSIINRTAYEEALSKAQAGVSGSITSPTVKPAGPPKAPSTPKTPSLPGIAAPNNPPGPGRPKGTSAATPPASGGKQMVDCPYGGGDQCVAAGGSGGKHHEAGGEEMQRHEDAMASGQHPNTPEGQQQLRAQTINAAINWSKQPKPASVVLDHMANGEVTTSTPLGDHEKGISDAYRTTIAGNGRALVKHSYGHDKTQEDWNRRQGDGFATIPKDTQHRREEAAYCLSSVLGLTDHIPPTAVRSHNGKMASAQAWLEDYQTLGIGQAATSASGSAAQNPENKGKNAIESFIASVPAEHKDKVINKLNEIVCMDIIMNNNDRHMDNLMVPKDLSDVKAIDHGLSFGTGMEGHKNVLHLQMQNSGRKVKIPAALRTKLENTSFGDLKRALKGKVEDWAVGQTYLRMKYLMNLQDTDGFLDMDKTARSSIGSVDGAIMPHGYMWQGIKDVSNEYWQRSARGHLPNQRFEAFAKKYIRTALNDKSHPDHETAKELDAVGIFMGPGSMKDPHEYRRSGKHKEYADKIMTHIEPDVKEYELDDSTGGGDAATAATGAGAKKTRPSDKTVVTKGLYLADRMFNSPFPKG